MQSTWRPDANDLTMTIFRAVFWPVWSPMACLYELGDSGEFHYRLLSTITQCDMFAHVQRRLRGGCDQEVAKRNRAPFELVLLTHLFLNAVLPRGA